MYYDDSIDVVALSAKSDFSIFVDQNSEEFSSKYSAKINPSYLTIIEPGKNNTITVNQIREIVSSSHTLHKKDNFYVIKRADLNDRLFLVRVTGEVASASCGR